MITKARKSNRTATKTRSVKKSPPARIRAGRSRIKNTQAYELTMKEIDALMKKGEKNLEANQLSRLKVLAKAAEEFEDRNDPLPLPSGLSELIRAQMFRLKLTQQFTARLLGISETKLSMIMNGRQRPDVDFLKALHLKLELDAHKMLEAV